MGTAQILIVEDQRIIAMDLEQRLTKLGYVVVGTVSSGVEARRTAAALHPTLILMDIGLRGSMTGIEAAEAIRTELQIPVVYVTAYAPENLPPQAQAAASPLYIQKPFDERQLHGTLQHILKSSSGEET
jgi:CheY-like chemotaxis protein